MADVPRLLVPSYLPNEMAVRLLRACVTAIRRHTPEDHEVWIVDNHSPWRYASKLLGWKDVNVTLSLRVPVPREKRGSVTQNHRAGSCAEDQTEWGSYANGVALELGLRIAARQADYAVTMHMDSMPCRAGWLSFLHSKLGERVKAAGVRMDRVRTPDGVLHVLGYMVDLRTFRALGLDFMPKLPRYDVGDYVTVGLRDAGYEVFACRNTLHEPDLIELIPETSPLRHVYMDRSFYYDGNVIFLHMGRAVPKSIGAYSVDGRRVITPEEYRAAGKTNVEEWLKVAAVVAGEA